MNGGLRGIMIDGFLVSYAATCTAALGFIVSDSTYKYVDPYVVWRLELFLITSGTFAGALRGFRSTAFAHHIDQVKVKEDAEEAAKKTELVLK